MDQLSYQLIGTLVTVASTMIPFVWHMASKFQKVSSDITNQFQKVSGEIKAGMGEVKVEITELKRQIQSLQEGMKDQANEVKDLRDKLISVRTLVETHSLPDLHERITRLEAQVNSLS